MFSTDVPTAAASLPTPASPGTPGYFTNGNPGSGIPATILDADFMNMVMLELQNIVTTAGLTPSKTNYTQVYQAIMLLANAPGKVEFFSQSSAPTGYLKANGAAVSRTTYALLFAAIGTTFGIGDGSTTFNVPDIRGEFVRGWDDSRGIDSGRTLGSWQKGSLVAIDIQNAATETITVAGATTVAAGQVAGGYDAYDTSIYSGVSLVGSTSAGTATLPGNSEISSGVVRPRNVALLACIKY